MEKERFDAVARSLANGSSRRSLVRTLGAAAVGAGAVAVTSRAADAQFWDPGLLDPDKDKKKKKKDDDGEEVCRPRCLRRCRRQRQRCVLRTGNPLRCVRRSCDDRCCDDD
jgi:hypothetical protein